MNLLAVINLMEFNNYSVIFRIVLSMFLCGIIGVERGIRNRPAGFMTYIMVGMGSTIIMLTNEYISSLYDFSDPSRMGAQVVSGIGFLGAGTIITTSKNHIKGLTTAAGIWSTAAVGLAVGVGFYSGAVAGAFLILFALTLLKKIDMYIKEHARVMELYIEYDEEFSMKTLSEEIDDKGYKLMELEFGRLKTINKEFGTLSCSIYSSKKFDHNSIITNIKNIAGICYIREIS